MKQRITTTIRIITFLCCIGIFIFLATYTINQRILKTDYHSAITAESTQNVQNPYRGFYHMYGYTLSEDNLSNVREWCNIILKQEHGQLVLLQINMKNYPDKDLSSNALKQLDLLLDKFTSQNKQLILRFIYDWDGKGKESEPDNIEQLASHMSDAADIVNKYKSHVFLLQGISTGNCGEMNGTNYSSEDELTYLMEHLASVIEPEIFLSVRTPAHLRGILKTYVPLAYSVPYNDTLASRLGLYNDGMLGSVYDLGTYDDTSFVGADNYLEAGTREEELKFQNQLCNYVPNGGEVTIDNVYNDIENAVRDLKIMHVTYLNRDHDLNVMNKWQNSTYEGINGLDYIEAHLGYRYVLTDSYINFKPFLDTQATLQLSIKNTGFAPAYREFETDLIIKHLESEEQYTIGVVFDNRSLLSEKTMNLSIEFPIRTYLKGTYELSLKMTDPATSLPIQFANEGSDKTIKVGTLTIN